MEFNIEGGGEGGSGRFMPCMYRDMSLIFLLWDEETADGGGMVCWLL